MNFKKFFFLIFFLIILLEIFFGYWVNKNPFHFVKTIYKDGDFVFYNSWHNGDNKIKIKFNKYTMRYDKDRINDLDYIFFGSGIVLQSTITENKTFIDYIKYGIDKKISNFGQDGQSSSGNLYTLELLKNYTDLKSKYFVFLIGANEAATNDNFSERRIKFWNFNKVISYFNEHSFFFKKLLNAIFNLKLIIEGNSFFQINAPQEKINKTKYFKPQNFVQVNISKNDYNKAKRFLEKQRKITEKNLIKIHNIVTDHFDSQIIFISVPNSLFTKNNETIKVYNKNLDLDNETNDPSFIKYNYLRTKIINDQVMNFCKKVSGICINGYDNIELTSLDFHDAFHLNEIGSKKVGNYFTNELKNISYE